MPSFLGLTLRMLKFTFFDRSATDWFLVDYNFGEMNLALSQKNQDALM
jgi:hypothetical protein